MKKSNEIYIDGKKVEVDKDGKAPGPGFFVDTNFNKPLIPANSIVDKPVLVQQKYTGRVWSGNVDELIARAKAESNVDEKAKNDNMSNRFQKR